MSEITCFPHDQSEGGSKILHSSSPSASLSHLCLTLRISNVGNIDKFYKYCLRESVGALALIES